MGFTLYTPWGILVRMHIRTISYKKVLFFAGGVGTILLLLYLFLFQAAAVPAQSAMTEPELYTVRASTTLPLPVSGTVLATSEVVLRAQTAGTIGAIYVTEGQMVSEGTLLIAQDAPVLAQSLEVQKAQARLQEAAQEAQVAAQQSAREKAEVLYGGALTQERLEGDAAVKRIDEQIQQLLSALDAAVSNTAAALDFLDVNRSYLSAESYATYLETVTALYGAQVPQFGTSVSYRDLGSGTVLRQIAEAQQAAAPNADTVLRLARELDVQMQKLQSVFIDSEDSFFDQRVLDVQSGTYAQYLLQRTAITTSQAQLRSGVSALQTLLDAAMETQERSDRQHRLAQIDRLGAETQEAYAREVATYTNNVNQAQLGVVRAQYGLSRNFSPFDGVVRDVYVERGEYVQPGSALLSLYDVSGYELSVRVPADVSDRLAQGQVFLVNDMIAGYVDRFSPILKNGGVTVYIQLLPDIARVGEVLSGTLLLDVSSQEFIYAIPRAYIDFTNTGPELLGLSGRRYPVRIMQDMSDLLYVQSVGEIGEALQPMPRIRL